eukprot:gene17344-23949_t
MELNEIGTENNVLKAELSTILDHEWANEWQACTNSLKDCGYENLIITVDCPKLVSTIMERYVIYAISTEPLSWIVHRRFNHFAWLRKKLTERYHGLYVPLIPAKSFFSWKYAGYRMKFDVDGEFIKDRCSHLKSFLNQLNKIPFVRTDHLYIAFLSITNIDEFNSFIKMNHNITNNISSKLSSEIGCTVDGLKQWQDIINHYTGDNFMQENHVNNIIQRLELLRNIFRRLGKQCIHTGRRAIALASSLQSLNERIIQWNELETITLDQPHLQEIKKSMEASIQISSQLCKEHKYATKLLARIIMSYVEYQLTQIDGFIRHLQQFQSLCKELRKLEKDYNKLYEDIIIIKNKLSYLSSSNEERIAKHRKYITDMEVLLEKKSLNLVSCRNHVEFFAKALFFCEIDRFNFDRQQSISYLLGSFATTNLQ